MRAMATPVNESFRRTLCWSAIVCGCASTPTAPKTPPPPVGSVSQQDAAADTTGRAITSIKPVMTDELIAAAEPKLEAYLRRVLVGTAGAAGKRSIELVEARPFAEGHVNETWYLAIDVDGEIDHAALKIFPDLDAADANAANFKLAHDNGWPVPTELVRSTTAPYSDRPSLLMEFMVGGSLKVHVKGLFQAAGDFAPDPAEIADLYAEVGDILGYLHKKHLRPRKASDATVGGAMNAALERCGQEGWCDDAAKKRFAALAEGLDDSPVTFCHGDLYESQIIMAEDGRVRAFIDLDTAGYCDPATDLGHLLAHVLMVNPAARAKSWKVPAPTARQVLLAYRASAEISEEEWPALYKRVKAHAWLRMAMLMVRYKGNAHAKEMLEGLVAHRASFTSADPFAKLGPL
jgi:aminoglycoside phosphotransferase (APT) family kinase protein